MFCDDVIALWCRTFKYFYDPLRQDFRGHRSLNGLQNKLIQKCIHGLFIGRIAKLLGGFQYRLVKNRGLYRTGTTTISLIP